jgi:hypothetical protein
MKTAFLKYTTFLLILAPLALAEWGWYDVPERAYNLCYFLAVAMACIFTFAVIATAGSGSWKTMKPVKPPMLASFIMMFFASLGWYWLASAWLMVMAFYLCVYAAQQSKKTAKGAA